MLIEGIYLYLMVVRVFNILVKMKMFYGFSWGMYKSLFGTLLDLLHFMTKLSITGKHEVVRETSYVAKKRINNSLYLDICPRKLSVPKSEQFSESVARGVPNTVSFEKQINNIQGQISEHFLAPIRGYCVHYPSNRFRSGRNFEN